IISFDCLFFRFQWNERDGEMFTWGRKRGYVELRDLQILNHLFLLANILLHKILLRNLILGRLRLKVVDWFFFRFH
ncbi:hypothetical protein PENTCL1PPCAC_12480, partial [Pristionchus entomophagus]